MRHLTRDSVLPVLRELADLSALYATGDEYDAHEDRHKAAFSAARRLGWTPTSEDEAYWLNATIEEVCDRAIASIKRWWKHGLDANEQVVIRLNEREEKLLTAYYEHPGYISVGTASLGADLSIVCDLEHAAAEGERVHFTIQSNTGGNVQLAETCEPTVEDVVRTLTSIAEQLS